MTPVKGGVTHVLIQLVDVMQDPFAPAHRVPLECDPALYHVWTWRTTEFDDELPEGQMCECGATAAPATPKSMRMADAPCDCKIFETCAKCRP